MVACSYHWSVGSIGEYAKRYGQLSIRTVAPRWLALPGKTRQSDEWQAAIEALLMAAEDRGPLMHARIGVLRALNRNVERVFDSTRKDTQWGKRKLKRDQ